MCSRNPECNELRCNVTHLNIRSLVRRATLTLLSCNQPAAAQLVLYNSFNTVILNQTQDRTTSHPFGNLLLSVQLMVTVEHPTGSQIRLGVKCLVNVYYIGGNIVQIDCLQFLTCTFCLSIQISAAIRGSPNTVQLLSNTDITLNTSACSQGRHYASIPWDSEHFSITTMGLCEWWYTVYLTICRLLFVLFFSFVGNIAYYGSSALQ